MISPWKSFICTSSCVPAQRKGINQRQYPHKKGVLGKCYPLCINQTNSDWKHPKEQHRFLWSFSKKVIFANCTTIYIDETLYNYLLVKSEVFLATSSISLVNFFFFSQGNWCKELLNNFPKVTKLDVSWVRPSSKFLFPESWARVPSSSATRGLSDFLSDPKKGEAIEVDSIGQASW